MPTNLSAEAGPIDNAVQKSSAINHRCCFICNSNKNEPFVQIYGTVTSHSNTPIFKYVKRFLDGKPSDRHEIIDEINSNRNLLCPRCFNKINDFDLACVTATRLHQELKRELSKTETIYASQKNAQKRTVEPELIIGIELDS